MDVDAAADGPIRDSSLGTIGRLVGRIRRLARYWQSERRVTGARQADIDANSKTPGPRRACPSVDGDDDGRASAAAVSVLAVQPTDRCLDRRAGVECQQHLELAAG